MGLVNAAADLLASEGDAALAALRVPDSRWRHAETYVFVLDRDGNMVLHPDPALEGKNVADLKDVNGRPIIRGLIDAATAAPDKRQGWYHYQWPVPDELLPRWKSSYVRLTAMPDGKELVVGSGMYNDRMEPAFVVDMVNGAVAQIGKLGKAAFPLLHDGTGPFMAKDAYVFVIDQKGVELVNPAFPNLEGRNVLDLKDTQGKRLVREMLEVVDSKGSGWVEYMWPKPGDSISTRKSTYVTAVEAAGERLLVGCGVYLADAPTAAKDTKRMRANDLIALVREGAQVLEREGEAAFPEFRREGSKWFRDDTYFFVWTKEGKRVFHAANPAMEGQDASIAKDVLGRPYGRMGLDAAAGPGGEGWVHYMYPEPGDIFPAWKSVFVKRVTFPSGQQHVLGAGIYNMQMDRAFIEDVVARASKLVAEAGPAGFEALRDKTGPFCFMDVYVFVDAPDGTELVNPVHPSLEGVNLMDRRDVKGKIVVRDYIDAALKKGSAWVEYYWYKPGSNTVARKEAYVRSVQSGEDTYVVGSGLYVEK